MMMPGREYQAQPSRFGFNGKENDNDVKGFGNQQDYGMRIYDTRIGKFLSVDPLSRQYPWNSTYAYAENEPISSVDLDGLEKKNFMEVLGGGIKKGVNEFTNSVRQTSRAALSKKTYRDAWDQSVEYAKTAINDPNTAIKKFNRGATNLSLGVGNTIQSYTSQPLMWALTIPERTKEENIAALGYGLWKGIELYVMTRAPELLESSEADAIFSKLNSEIMPAYEGNMIISNALRGGARIVIVAEEEAALMRAMGKEAGIRWMGDGVADIQIHKGASRAAIMEEAIHYEQYLKYGEEFMSNNLNRIRMEIEAQNRLLKIGAREGWSGKEIQAIKKAKVRWERELRIELKKK